MQDKELYQYILGLQSPSSVSEVKLDMQSQEILVRVEHPRGTKFCCPDCRKELACYDHGEERHWRHLDSCQFKTILVARVRGKDCSRSFPCDEDGQRGFELASILFVHSDSKLEGCGPTRNCYVIFGSSLMPNEHGSTLTIGTSESSTQSLHR